MKHSFKNLFVIIMILISLIGSSIQATSVDALAYPDANITVSLPASWQTAKLIDVWGYDASNVYIAGNGTSSGATLPLIYKKNGTAWDPSTPGLPTAPGTWTSGSLKAVWGADTTNIYTVGNGTSSGATLPVIYKKNGTAWDPSSPDLPVTEGEPWIAGFLEDVWGPSASDVYAVGYGSTFGAPTKPLVYRSTDNGANWEYSLPPLLASWNGYLYGVWGSAANDVYVVGFGNEGTTTVPLIYHSSNSGANWTQTSLSLPTGWSNGSLYSIWGSAANDIYAVGSGHNGTTTVPLVYRYNGSSWVLFDPLPLMPSGWNTTTLTSVWGAGGIVYAAGYGTNGDTDTVTPLMYRKTSSGWAATIPAMNGWDSRYLESMWGSDAYNMYFVGYGDTPTDNDQPLLYYAGNDTTAPGAVTALNATSGLYNGTVSFSWTAPADDAGNNNSGPVDSYLVKYSTSSLTDCSGGTTGVPVPATPGTTQTMTVSGLTRGTLYYFAICAQDEEGLSSTAATISATAQATGVAKYDNTDPYWTYTGTWTASTGSGPYNNTWRTSNTVGSEAQFTFTGARFALTYVKASNRGLIDVYVDGTKIGTINAYSSTLAWQQTWTSTTLNLGVHTVRFVHAGGGTYIDIDALEIFAPPDPVGAGTYDDTHVNWMFSLSSGWATYAGAGPYNNTLHIGNTVGNEAQFTFNGVKFKLTYVKASNRGLIDVYVDGTKIDTINANSPTLAWQQTWTSPTLSSGIHLVRFVHAGGGTYIDIDAIQIINPPPPVSAGIYDDPNTSWTFSGGWATYAGAGPYNNTLHYANTVGSEAQLSFIGAKFKLTYVTANNRGLIDVYVDGTKIHTINAYSVSTLWQQTWTSPVFTAGTHTVRFVHAGGGTYIDVDAIQIYSASDTLPPAAISDLSATTGATSGTVTLNWTAVGDDAGTGTATNYLVRYSTSAISSETAWNAATPVSSGIPTPKLAGLAETMTVSGLVPGWTYYFAVRAQDEEPNLGGLSNSPSAVANSPTPVPVGKYDDTDSNWVYAGTWTAYTGAGPYNNTWHTATAGSSAQITFDGVKFTVTYVKASNRGLIDVYVDGTKIYTINANGAFAWQQTWTSPTLIPGVHTVRFVHAGSGTYIDVDAIEIFGPPPPVTAGTYDDTHTNWVFSNNGGWATYAGTGPYNNTLHYANVVGSEAQITFNGAQFKLTYVKSNNRGLIDVYVDGIKIDTINAYSASTLWQQIWTSPSYTPGVHTVRFVHAGSGMYIDIDAIQILNVADTVAPAAIGDLLASTGTTGGTVDLTWTAPGDDNNSGTATNYLVRYSSSVINSETAWNAATPVSSGIPTPAIAGTAQSMTVAGLSPGATYYFAVRAQDEEPNLGGLSNSPSAVANSPTPVLVGKYDDTDSNWVYAGTWTAYTGAGPYNNTWRTGTTGSDAQITFNGAKFTVTYVKASNRGLIDVYVDGTKIYTINATSATLAWQQTWTSPTLIPGVHTVRFVHAGSGAYIDIDAIEIFGAPSPVGAGTYDDNHASWAFSVAGWETYSGAGPYNNTLHIGNLTGCEAQFVFTGTRFTLTYVKSSNRGLIDVYVDGVKVDTINAYSASTLWQQTWTSATYTSGTHTVRFVHAGSGLYIDVDAITIE